MIIEKELTVAECIARINAALSAEVRSVRVRGEVSDCSVRRGMAFFDLKDAETREHALKCYVSRWDFEYIGHILVDGAEVIVEGSPNVYKTGFLNLMVRRAEPIGEGGLKRAFEALKTKLAAAGWFDEARKQPLPPIVRRIGLITSAAGEAINDFRKNIGEHAFAVVFIDTMVEGVRAEPSIVSAIRKMNRAAPRPDVLVLIRGGGGLENLKSFNSERVAEAIFQSKIPIMAGIGHEGDETISDLVADIRCSTPTAVARALREHRENLLTRIADQEGTLLNETRHSMQEVRHHITLIEHWLSHALRLPAIRFRELVRGLLGALENCVRLAASRRSALTGTETFLVRTESDRLARAADHVADLARTLQALGPLAVLRRGYAIAETSDGRAVKNTTALSAGDRLRLTFAKGAATAEVKSVEK